MIYIYIYIYTYIYIDIIYIFMYICNSKCPPEALNLHTLQSSTRLGSASNRPHLPTFPTFGNIRPVKMNHSSPRNPIFEIPRARNCKNDKFVTVGVPGTETNANLIFLFIFKLFSNIVNPTFSIYIYVYIYIYLYIYIYI